jgi:hypothetical protein
MHHSRIIFNFDQTEQLKENREELDLDGLIYQVDEKRRKVDR